MRIIKKGEGQTAPLDFGIPAGYRLYLSGGMEYADDYGAGWRGLTIKSLKPLKFTFYNPCEEEKPIMKHHQLKDSSQLFSMKNWQDLRKATSVVRDFLIKDRNVIYDCDALIVYYDKSTQLGGGTAMEQAWANEAVNEKNPYPIYFVIGKGFELKNVSLSMLSMSTHIFETLDDCLIYLKRARGLYEQVA